MSMQSRIRSLLSGMAFGSALTLAGVGSPQVIKDQFRFTDFHMLVTFLTASTSSAAIFAIYNMISGKELLPKSNSNLGWFCRYDGNIIGGAAIGAGMSLTVACPGTVLVQATAGVAQSRLLLISALMAGIGFVCWKLSPMTCKISSETSETIMSACGWSLGSTVVGYEIAMIGVIAAALQFADRSQTMLHPVIGGFLIGFGQLLSVLLMKKPVGVSGAYEDIGKLVCDGLSGKAMISVSQNIIFAGGLVAGSAITMVQAPVTRELLMNGPSPLLLSSLAGAFIMIFGARITGGCTSGHGISGMAAMSLSSIITIASMFSAGILMTSLGG